MLAISSTSQIFGLLAPSAVACREADSEPQTLPAVYPDAGYVYLSISPVMPGFVRVAVSKEDPLQLNWSLETMSGVTRFHTVHSSWSGDCHALMAQFQSALSSNQIPHHPELFKIPLRFARQVLLDEAKGLPSAPAPVVRTRKKTYAVAVAAAVAALAASFFFLPAQHPPAPKLTPAYRHSAPQLRM